MSSCAGCGVTISCEGGCGQVCFSDCSGCWGWCEPVVLEFDTTRETLDGSVKLNVCTEGIGPDSLLGGIQAFIGARLEWTDESAADGPGDLEFSGTVDELLEQTGLRHAEAGHTQPDS